MYLCTYFHVTSINIFISYSYCRVDNMLSKCFAVIIPLLSCQLTLIHTQSMQYYYFNAYAGHNVYTYMDVLMQCVFILCNLVTIATYWNLLFIQYIIYECLRSLPWQKCLQRRILFINSIVLWWCMAIISWWSDLSG